MSVSLHQGDCLDALRGMADNSVDSIVTDPPYGLAFMGKKWDYDVPSVEIWAECLRVLKPGGHLLAFAGTRTQHRMAVRIEDAGFEIRDMIAWVYGQGFPKSLDVSKQIDKAAGVEREVIGPRVRLGDVKPYAHNETGGNCYGAPNGKECRPPITAPATDAARQWQGWGTALKPALEPITMARKPLVGTVAANVLAHGTGALHIDACRIATDPNVDDQRLGGAGSWTTTKHQSGDTVSLPRGTVTSSKLGRWPANLILQDSDEVRAGFPATGKSTGGGYAPTGDETIGYGDDGSAARFFYCAKASKKDRDEGLESFIAAKTNDGRAVDADNAYQRGASLRQNTHPTVKPTDLMAYLCRLVTPPGGVVLDPFMGSGSTGKAALREGFGFIGCEMSPEYTAIARARIEAALAELYV